MVEGEKFKLRKLPSRFILISSRRKDCPVLKHSRVSEVLKGLTYMILSFTVKEITKLNGNLVYVIYRSCHLLFIYVDVEKTVGKRAQI